MGRSILAVVLGMVLAFVIVLTIETAGQMIYTPPAGLDSADPASLHDSMGKLPTGVFLILLAGWMAGASSGAWLSARIARRARIIHGSIVGGFIIAAAIAIMLHIPHPAWFWAVSLMSLLAATYAGALLGCPGKGSRSGGVV